MYVYVCVCAHTHTYPNDRYLPRYLASIMSIRLDQDKTSHN